MIKLLAITTVVGLLLCSLLPSHSWLLVQSQSARTTGTHDTSLSAQKRTISRRWVGNYKPATTELSQITKAKKLELNITANGITKTLVKNRMESIQHVLTKAVLWKLFMDEYPDIQIELDIGDPNYLPDVVSFDPTNSNNDNNTHPVFWGEAGRMRVHKAIDLLQRYPDTHIVQCRWGVDIDQFRTPLLGAIEEQQEEHGLVLPVRTQPFTCCVLPLDVWRYVDESTMTVHITKEDLKWQTLFDHDRRPEQHNSTTMATVAAKPIEERIRRRGRPRRR